MDGIAVVIIEDKELCVAEMRGDWKFAGLIGEDLAWLLVGGGNEACLGALSGWSVRGKVSGEDFFRGELWFVRGWIGVLSAVVEVAFCCGCLWRRVFLESFGGEAGESMDVAALEGLEERGCGWRPKGGVGVCDQVGLGAGMPCMETSVRGVSGCVCIGLLVRRQAEDP